MKRLKYRSDAESGFFDDLREEVYEVLPKNYRAHANRPCGIKALLLLLFFACILLTLYFVPLQTSLYLTLIAVLGMTCLPLILNIGHEAVHHNFSTIPKWNSLATHIYHLLGTSAYFWELRHNASHHAFANVKNADLDIEQSTIIRLSKHQEHQKRHSYQHLYMPIAFCFYTLLWFFYRDFKDLGKTQFGAKTITKHPLREQIKLFMAKIWHLVMLLAIPYACTQDLMLVFWGFVVFHLAASMVTTFALISTHVGEAQEIVFANDGTLPYTWAEHQLRTTADFSSGSFFMLHFFGGFNHHVAHHLFPRVPHIYYPIITPLIKKHAEIHKLPYYCYPDLLTSAVSHFKRLKKLSLQEI